MTALQDQNMSLQLKGLKQLRVFWVFMRRQIKVWSFFRISFLFDIIGMIVGVSIYLFIGKMFDGASSEFLDSYGGDFIAFVIVGVAFYGYASTSLNAYYNAIHQAYWSAKLEMFLLSHLSPITFLIANVLWSYFMVTVSAIIYLVFGFYIFHAIISIWSNLLITFCVIAVTVLSMSGLGLISASMFSYLNARGGNEPVRWFVGLMGTLASGVYFPPQLLPGWLMAISYSLPQTYALDAIRRLLIPSVPKGPTLWNHYFFSPIWSDILVLVTFTIFLLPIGYFLFESSLKKAQTDGRLSRWV